MHRVFHRGLAKALLSRAALCLAVAGWSLGMCAAVEMEWVVVGDANNPEVPPAQNIFGLPNLGSVTAVFQMGKYEVTNAQYAEFLNAKAASDPYSLYDGRMDADSSRGGITRSGPDGSYSYAVKPGFANKPVVFVNFYDAVRFANWLHNEQGTGDTEAGAYNLTPNPGFPPNPDNGGSVVRQPTAKVFLPTENEWYKAAYYQGNAIYRQFPMRSDTTPVAESPSGGPLSGNFAGAVNGGTLTPVGAYLQAAGPYGTFDQGGNATEWLETINAPYRVLRGGHFNNGSDTLGAFQRGYGFPNEAYEHSGFRVASSLAPPAVPVPPRGLGKIMALGDSLTQSQNNLFSYRYYLWTKLLDQGVEFDFVGTLLDNGIGGFPPWPNHQGKPFDQNHEGHSGLRTDQIRDQVLNWTVGYVPDVALIIAGTNDAISGRNSALAAADLKEIIVRLRLRNSQMAFYLAKIPPVGASITVGGLPVNDYIDSLNGLIGTLPSDPALAGARITIVDLNSGFNFATDGLSDGIHPNAAGEQKIAARFFEAFQVSTLNSVSGVDAAGHLTMSFLRIQAPFHLTYTVEVSSNLQQWFSGPAETELIASSDQFNGTESVTIRDRKSPLTDGQRFIRLRLRYGPPL